MGKWDGGVVPANVAVKDKTGNQVVCENVAEIRVPTDEVGVTQSYFDLMRLGVYLLAGDSQSASDNKIVCKGVVPILFSRAVGNYGHVIEISTSMLDDHGYVTESGNKTGFIVVTNKTLTEGKRYSIDYLNNNRG
jgi:hypothetical protein